MQVLLSVVGHGTTTSARIFVCAEALPNIPLVARLVWRSGDVGGSTDLRLMRADPYHTGVFDLSGLPAGAEVTYVIAVADRAVALQTPDELFMAGVPRTFRLLPVGRPPKIALLSCNGTVEVADANDRYPMWVRLCDAIEAGEVDMVIHAGDQVYADDLVKDAEAKGHEPRAEDYRKLYVEAWQAPEVVAVLTRVPNLMMWDDHDIVDGWGSNENDLTAPRQAIFKAARQAFSEFQASHNPPGIDPTSFASGATLGEVAVLLLDARSNRCYEQARVLGAPQFDQMRLWLDTLPQTCRRVFVVLGIPPVHAAILRVAVVPKWLRVDPDLGSDLRDAWVSPGNQTECAELIASFHAFLAARPNLELTILAGDVHVGTIGTIKPGGEGRAFWQVTSSGIATPAPGLLPGWILKRVTREPVVLGAGAEGHLLPVMPNDCEILLHRNFAILKTQPDNSLKVKFVAEDLPAPLEFALAANGEHSQTGAGAATFEATIQPR